jgi:hypothetical protein
MYREPPVPSTPPAPPPSRLPRPPLTKSVYWTSYCTLLILPLVVAAVVQFVTMSVSRDLVYFCVPLYLTWMVGFVAWSVVARRRSKAWNKTNGEAVRLIGEGEPLKAAALLDDVLARSRPFAVVHSLYLWNRALAGTRLGHFAEARVMLRSILATDWFSCTAYAPFVPSVMISLGTVEALAGRLEEAESWQRKAKAKLLASSAPIDLALGLLVAARRGTLDDAEALCQANWGAAEATLSAREMKLLRVLRAFVAHLRAPEQHALVDTWLAGVKPVPNRMFAYLGAEWPEFAVFEQAELRAA